MVLLIRTTNYIIDGVKCRHPFYFLDSDTKELMNGFVRNFYQRRVSGHGTTDKIFGKDSDYHPVARIYIKFLPEVFLGQRTNPYNFRGVRSGLGSLISAMVCSLSSYYYYHSLY